MQARRNQLEELGIGAEPSHAGLWLDRYLSSQLPKGVTVDSVKGTQQQSLVVETCAISVPAIYEVYYKTWKQVLQTQGAICREAVVQGRMAVGLGAESVIETAVRLHHTYGVPFIPGSALKGLAANYAHQQYADKRWQKGGEAHTVIFGSPQEAGFVTFYDALYVPDSGRPLHPDVITVHHPDYYKEGKNAPADWDNPNPISFISATGTYLIALEGEHPLWVHAAFNILQEALEKYGVGAKTSSGYGRLAVKDSSPSPTPVKKKEDRSAVLPPGFESGRIKSFGLGPKRSYGFISPASGGKEVFVHQSQLPPGTSHLQEGQPVHFQRVKDSKGEHAENVRLVQ